MSPALINQFRMLLLETTAYNLKVCATRHHAAHISDDITNGTSNPLTLHFQMIGSEVGQNS